MKNFKKSIALLVAVSMIVGCVIGGALAWLTSTSGNVVNTFTTSDINISLNETKGDLNSDSNHKKFKMIPGWTIEKDPKVTVVSGSEDCWLFVKLDKSTNFDNFMTYEIADGWTALTGVTNVSDVYYRKVQSADMGTAYSILKNDKVTVKSTVTKEMMNDLTTATYPTLTVTAYASQLYKNNTEEFTPGDAWNNVNPTT